jgi:glycosyltransferase involved in cell wall biosynthesis
MLKYEEAERPSFIELAKLAKVQGQSIHFVIIGDGDLRSELEEKSQNLPISFLGWQSNSAQWLAISDIAILLSDNEAVPLAMIEAGLADPRMKIEIEVDAVVGSA